MRRCEILSSKPNGAQLSQSQSALVGLISSKGLSANKKTSVTSTKNGFLQYSSASLVTTPASKCLHRVFIQGGFSSSHSCSSDLGHRIRPHAGLPAAEHPR
jgi:hypothetical protein